MIKNLDEINADDLLIHINYLNKKGYVHTKQIYDGFAKIQKLTITAEGIDLFSNKDTLNSEFPK